MMERLESLITDNDGLRRELDDARWEVASANELLTEKIVDVSYRITMSDLCKT